MKMDFHFNSLLLCSFVLFIVNWYTGVMNLPCMMCPVHRKPSLAWRFESVDLERLSSRLWAPAVSQRQKSTNKTEEKDEGTVEMWTCELKVQLSLLWTCCLIHVFIFSVLPALSACCLMLQFPPAVRSPNPTQWRLDAAAGPPGTRNHLTTTLTHYTVHISCTNSRLSVQAIRLHL